MIGFLKKILLAIVEIWMSLPEPLRREIIRLLVDIFGEQFKAYYRSHKSDAAGASV